MPPRQKPGRSKQNYRTPPEFMLASKRRLGIEEFAIDLAADAENRQAERYFDEATNGLAQSWVTGGWNWLNPPFGDIAPWVEHAHWEKLKGAETAILVPASIGANWWKAWVDGRCLILALNGRITFEGETDAYPKDCALLLYSPRLMSGYEVWSWMDTLTDEEREMAKTRTKKPTKPTKAKKVFTATTKAGKRAEQKAAASASKPAAGRVTTVKPNGSGSMQPAPERTAKDHGPLVLPNPEDSQRVLEELGGMYDKAAELKARYEELKDLTKTAKEKYDAASDAILDRIRVTTHKSDLPLFDAEERERDQAAMEAAGDAAGEVAQEPPADGPDDPTGNDLGQGGTQLPEEATSFVPEAPAGSAPVLDDDPPF